MKINVTQPCPACKGHKKQVHPSWLELYEARRRKPGLKTADFFYDLGYISGDERPPLLIACRNCRGAGEVEAWLTLDVLLPKIFTAFREFIKQDANADQPSI